METKVKRRCMEGSENPMNKILAELASTCCGKDDGCGKLKKNDKQLLLIIIVVIVLLCSCGGGRPNIGPFCGSNCGSNCGSGNKLGGSWIWLILLFVFLCPGLLGSNAGNINTNLINVDTDDGAGYEDQYYD